MLLIVDATQLAYRSFFAGGHLSYGGSETGVIYKFLLQIEAVAKRVPEPMTLVFCWDHKVNKRKLLDPNYKKHRKAEIEGIEDMFNQIDYLQNEFVEIGFYSYLFSGFEADDLIAAACLENPDQNKLIFSSDQDLYQLLDNRTSVITQPRKKGLGLYTEGDFQKEYGINPDDWVLVKTIAGCSTDNVIGVPGIGEKRAIEFIKGTLSERLTDSIMEHWNVVEPNFKLVYLPIEDVKIRKLKHRSWNHDRFHTMLVKKGIRNIDQKVWRNKYDSGG